MSRNRKHIERRNEKIKKEFDKLSKKEYNGRPLYRYNAMLAMLSEQFYLDEITLQRILKQQ